MHANVLSRRDSLCSPGHHPPRTIPLTDALSSFSRITHAHSPSNIQGLIASFDSSCRHQFTDKPMSYACLQKRAWETSVTVRGIVRGQISGGEYVRLPRTWPPCLRGKMQSYPPCICQTNLYNIAYHFIQ